MVYKVVSTKLNEKEHKNFLEFCNKKGLSSSEFIKNSIIKMMDEEFAKDVKNMTTEELFEIL